MNPNHYLAAAILYLFTHRPDWRADAAVGKTVVSSSMIDRVAAKVGRALVEVPVGFKWFVPGLLDGSLGFGGEESAGASFLRRDGTVWTTDKDGIIMDLLAVEIMARTGRDPSELYAELTRELGAPVYERIDAPATPEEEGVLLHALARRCQRSRARRRPDSSAAHDRARQRRAHRRPESHHHARLVRRASVRHGGRLQAVRGELSRERPPAADPGGSAGDHRQDAGGSDEMTSEALTNGAPPLELSSVVRATDEEKQVLLRRAFLIRHGETEWSLSGQHTGTTDIPLTENGRNAARRLEPLLARATFALVLTSPLGRARQTCELAGLGAHAEVDANLIEWNYGEYEGLTPKQIHAKAPGWMLSATAVPAEKAPSQVGARVDRVIARIRSVEGDVALFAHGHVFRVFAARWLGLPAAAGCHFLLDPATVSVLSHYRGIPAVKRWNAPLVP